MKKPPKIVVEPRAIPSSLVFLVVTVTLGGTLFGIFWVHSVLNDFASRIASSMASQIVTEVPKWTVSYLSDSVSMTDFIRSSLAESLSRGDSKTRLEVLKALEQVVSQDPKTFDVESRQFLVPLLEECRFDCDPAVRQLSEQLRLELAEPGLALDGVQSRTEKAATL